MSYVVKLDRSDRTFVLKHTTRNVQVKHVGRRGPQGEQGETGPAGVGIASGGSSGQVLAKNSNTDYDTLWVTPTVAWGAITGSLFAQGDLLSALDGRVATAGDTMTGPLLLPNGTAGAPALSFSGDTDSGIFLASAGIIDIALAGVRQYRLQYGHIGLEGKTNPINAVIYMGTGTGSLTDTDQMAFKAKFDTVSGGRSFDMHQVNMNIVDGTLADRKALGYVARIDLNDTATSTARSDVVSLWGDVFVHSASTRPTWGANIYVQIDEGVNYSESAVGAEIGVHNFGSVVNGGGALSLRFHGDTDVRFGISMAADGDGSYQHAIQVNGNAGKGPNTNLIYYGELATNNIPTGTVYYQTDYLGNTGIKTGVDTNYALKVGGATNITGNIVVGGTVDGRDIAADGTTLDSLNTNAVLSIGRSGGQLVKGGTTSSENLDIYANTAAFDSSNTGRIRLFERIEFNQSFQIDHDNGGLFKTWDFKLFSVSGTQTVQSGGNIGGSTVLYANHTIALDQAQVFSAVTLFDANPTIEPTTAVSLTDTSTEYRMFFARPNFAPNISTASTVTTNTITGYNAAPGVGIKAGSHASAASVVQLAVGFKSTGGVGNQGTITDYAGFYAATPAASGTGVITNAYGLYVESMTAGTNRYGARIDTPSTSGATNVRTLWISANADNTTDESGIFAGSSANTRFHRTGAGAWRIIGSGGGANGVGGQLAIANRYNTDTATRNGLVLTAGADSNATGSIVINRAGSTVSTITASASSTITMSATTHNFSSGSAVIQLAGNIALERSTTVLRIGEGFTGGVLIRSNSSTAPLTLGTTNQATLYQDGANVLRTGGLLRVRAGLTANAVEVGGTVTVNTTTVGNVGTGEDDLMSYSLPADTLGTDGDGLEIEVWGAYANNANAKRIRMYFGSNLIFDSGASGIPTGSAGTWQISAKVVRTGAATQTILTTSGTDPYRFVVAGTQTLSGAVTIKVTGEATSNNDVTQNAMHIKWLA